MAEDLSQLQTAMLGLIRRFVERQKIVREAIQALRPDVLAYYREDVGDEELLEMTRAYLNAPRVGHWGAGDEWAYVFHETGCRLVHTVTQEPLEWDAPDLLTFDRFWLVNYLEWCLRTQESEAQLESIRAAFSQAQRKLPEFTFSVLDELEAKKVIARSDVNASKYKLLVEG